MITVFLLAISLGMLTGLMPGLGVTALVLSMYHVISNFSIVEMFVFYSVLVSTTQYYGNISSIIYGTYGELTSAPAVADAKVNAGSFKGYVAVYARGYEGQRLSAKIGNDWVIVDPIVNNESDTLFRVTDFTGAGVDIAVRIYIDRVLIDTINLTTK